MEKENCPQNETCTTYIESIKETFNVPLPTWFSNKMYSLDDNIIFECPLEFDEMSHNIIIIVLIVHGESMFFGDCLLFYYRH